LSSFEDLGGNSFAIGSNKKELGAKMKKLLMTTLLMGFCLNSTTARAISTDKLKGFYITAGVGAMTFSSKTEIDSLDGTAADKVKRNLSNTNVSLQGIIGYEKTFGDNYVAGIEALYIWTSNGVDMLNNLNQGGGGGLVTFPAKDSLKSKNSWGIAGIFGRQFDKLTPYAKIGITSTSFEMKAFSSDATKNIDGIDKKRYYGLLLGGGLRYSLNDSLDVITEFQALMYRNLKSKNFDTDAADRHIINIKPTFYNVWAGLRWKF
jgi:opacity protein-like surface antigen